MASPQRPPEPALPPKPKTKPQSQRGNMKEAVHAADFLKTYGNASFDLLVRAEHNPDNRLMEAVEQVAEEIKLEHLAEPDLEEDMPEDADWDETLATPFPVHVDVQEKETEQQSAEVKQMQEKMLEMSKQMDWMVQQISQPKQSSASSSAATPAEAQIHPWRQQDGKRKALEWAAMAREAKAIVAARAASAPLQVHEVPPEPCCTPETGLWPVMVGLRSPAESIWPHAAAPAAPAAPLPTAPPAAPLPGLPAAAPLPTAPPAAPLHGLPAQPPTAPPAAPLPGLPAQPPTAVPFLQVIFYF